MQLKDTQLYANAVSGLTSLSERFPNAREDLRAIAALLKDFREVPVTNEPPPLAWDTASDAQKQLLSDLGLKDSFTAD